MLERKDPTSWLKSVSAFANTQGGRLLFGVANDGVLVGLADAQGDAEFISEAIKTQMDPVPEINLSIHEERGKRFVVVEVKAGSETPYYTFVKGHRDAFIRIGNEKRGETVVPRLESTNSAFFLTLPNLNYGRIINGVASSSVSTERDTVIKTDTITKNIDDTISKNHSSNEAKTARTPLLADVNRHVVTNADNGTDSNPISKTISKESWEILKVISECRHISAEQIGRMLGLSASGVRYHIRALTSKSLIRRVGSAKTGHWEIVK